MKNTATSWLGLELRNPVIAASSGLTEHLPGLTDLEKNGVGAVVLKSLFEEEILLDIDNQMKQMASDSFIYPETVEFYEQDERIREHAMQYLDLIRSAKKELSVPVIASINCVTAENWIYFPREIELAGADALELNVFILPTDTRRTAQESESVYFDIVQQVCKLVKIPLALKISPYFTNLISFADQISGMGIQGMVLFNRSYNPDIDIEKLEITSAGVLSTPADIYNSLRWIAILSSRLKCDLAASSGIHDGKALIKQILAGAKAVQIASAIYKNGPGIITKMLEELSEWAQQKKFDSIEQFRGMLSQSKTGNPAAYERVQFMKYFRGYHPSAMPPDYI
ncbi:MAG TPA: dihydroorotate dehydrogenase-like protein [Bacteroidales bacterium]|nr:dihydroorotate dehydrogenase-like protein [Bacteroidales bacterium]